MSRPEPKWNMLIKACGGGGPWDAGERGFMVLRRLVRCSAITLKPAHCHSPAGENTKQAREITSCFGCLLLGSADSSIICGLSPMPCAKVGKQLNLRRNSSLTHFPEHYVSITASRFISSVGSGGWPSSCNVSAAELSRGSRDPPLPSWRLTALRRLTPRPPFPRLSPEGSGWGEGQRGFKAPPQVFYERPEQRLHLYHRCGSVSAARSRVRTEFAMELAAARLEIEINVGWGGVGEEGGWRAGSSPTASSCVSHKALKSAISRRLNPLDLPFLSPHNELFTFNYPASGVARSQDIVARAQ